MNIRRKSSEGPLVGFEPRPAAGRTEPLFMYYNSCSRQVRHRGASGVKTIGRFQELLLQKQVCWQHESVQDLAILTGFVFRPAAHADCCNPILFDVQYTQTTTPYTLKLQLRQTRTASFTQTCYN